MQRFGTAAVPTHSIGLALLKSDWNKAVDLILQQRHGEHPDVAEARHAWLVERDLDKALRLLPRRVVAERCILESYKKMKGDTRNAMGALSTVGPDVFPTALRLMEGTDPSQLAIDVYSRVPVLRLERDRVRTH